MFFRKRIMDNFEGKFAKLPITVNYDLHEKIGEGTFSRVYLAKPKEGKQPLLALKHLVPISKPARIKKEILCLKSACHPNVIPLCGFWRNGPDIIIATQYIKSCKFKDFIQTTDLEEVKLYMRNLFSALAHIHKIGTDMSIYMSIALILSEGVI